MAMTLITTNTETNATSSSFTSSIDSTYKLYVFKIINYNPNTDGTIVRFNGSTDGGSNYNVTKTSTVFVSYLNEDGSGPTLGYSAGDDLAQGTGYQNLSTAVGNGSDESASGTLWLFNPSNTTYVKHFYATLQAYNSGNFSVVNYTSGYFNTTSAIDAVDFDAASGNFDGTIKMYGVG